MQVIQCKHPSEPECKTVKKEVKQTVCIDVYDIETAFKLKSVLDQICDTVSLTGYGSNLYHVELQMDHEETDIMNRVSKELCRICRRAAPKTTPFKSVVMKPCAMVE